MTASDVTENPNPPNGWPAKPGFDLQYGYGRPNVLKAIEAVGGEPDPARGMVQLAALVRAL